MADARTRFDIDGRKKQGLVTVQGEIGLTSGHEEPIADVRRGHRPEMP